MQEKIEYAIRNTWSCQPPENAIPKQLLTAPMRTLCSLHETFVMVAVHANIDTVRTRAFVCGIKGGSRFAQPSRRPTQWKTPGE